MPELNIGGPVPAVAKKTTTKAGQIKQGMKRSDSGTNPDVEQRLFDARSSAVRLRVECFGKEHNQDVIELRRQIHYC